MWLAFLGTPPVTTFEMEGSVVGKYIIFGKCCELHFITHYFHTGLSCPELPLSWPVQTWLLLPLVHHILTQFVWVSSCNSAHHLGQSKCGCCFLLCVVSLLNLLGCQTVFVMNRTTPETIDMTSLRITILACMMGWLVLGPMLSHW